MHPREKAADPDEGVAATGVDNAPPPLPPPPRQIKEKKPKTPEQGLAAATQLCVCTCTGLTSCHAYVMNFSYRQRNLGKQYSSSASNGLLVLAESTQIGNI